MLFFGCLSAKGQLLVFGTVSVKKAFDQAISFLKKKKRRKLARGHSVLSRGTAKSLCSCEAPEKRFKNSICSADRQTVIPLAGLANQSTRQQLGRLMSTQRYVSITPCPTVLVEATCHG